jgi:LigD, primase-polymerase domain
MSMRPNSKRELLCRRRGSSSGRQGGDAHWVGAGELHRHPVKLGGDEVARPVRPVVGAIQPDVAVVHDHLPTTAERDLAGRHDTERGRPAAVGPVVGIQLGGRRFERRARSARVLDERAGGAVGAGSDLFVALGHATRVLHRRLATASAFDHPAQPVGVAGDVGEHVAHAPARQPRRLASLVVGEAVEDRTEPGVRRDDSVELALQVTTWALFDIDPGDAVGFDEVLELARLHRTALEHLGVDACPKVAASAASRSGFRSPPATPSPTPGGGSRAAVDGPAVGTAPCRDSSAAVHIRPAPTSRPVAAGRNGAGVDDARAALQVWLGGLARPEHSVQIRLEHSVHLVRVETGEAFKAAGPSSSRRC